jgi:hypothetical protein
MDNFLLTAWGFELLSYSGFLVCFALILGVIYYIMRVRGGSESGWPMAILTAVLIVAFNKAVSVMSMNSLRFLMLDGGIVREPPPFEPVVLIIGVIASIIIGLLIDLCLGTVGSMAVLKWLYGLEWKKTFQPAIVIQITYLFLFTGWSIANYILWQAVMRSIR